MTRLVLLCLILSLTAGIGSGCAPAYRCYSGCRVPCKYCPPAPMPYTPYCGCECHSWAAERYLVGPPASSEMNEEEAATQEAP